eukprot:809128-Ditylum_brightwellii.AAC.1
MILLVVVVLMTIQHHSGQCKVPYLADLYPGPTLVEKFFDALKFCHASTLGFKFPVHGHGGEKLCYCPYGKHMKNWRSLLASNNIWMKVTVVSTRGVYYGDFNGKKPPHYALITNQATAEYNYSAINHGMCLMEVPWTTPMQKTK